MVVESRVYSKSWHRNRRPIRVIVLAGKDFVWAISQAFELNETLSVRDNILEGASDVLAWIREYESGQGTEAHQATLLEKNQFGRWLAP